MPKASKKKRPFIDKNNAVSFHLVHRSQRDPLIADSDAPQHVLVESNRADCDSTDHRLQRDGISRSLNTVATTSSSDQTKKKRKDEQVKYGIFYDDDYNYLQHLKMVGETSLEPADGFSDVGHRLLGTGVPITKEKKEGRLNLPSSLFPSEIEDNIGVLNRAAPFRGPRPELDPDVIEALQSDYSDCEDSDGSFDDHFVQRANEKVENENDNDDNMDESNSEGDNFQDAFADEETKSRFTNYSMSSSVIRRNDGLTLLDDRFEKIFEEYEDNQIGALDSDDVDGYLTFGDPLMESAIKDYKALRMTRGLMGVVQSAFRLESNGTDESDCGEEQGDDDEEEEREEETMIIIDDKPNDKWDCESILSTYSTLYNHPRVIKEPSKPKPIKISTKISKSGLTVANLRDLEASTRLVDPSMTAASERSVATVAMRPKGETLEEKRERKKAVKIMRQERRVEKKANTLAFKEEKKKQEKVLLNLEQNLKGIKLR